MDRTETLMLGGVAAICPDCGDERLLVEVGPSEFCCTTCDAAVLVLDALVANVPRGAPRDEGRRAS